MNRAPIEHELKCWPDYFQAVKDKLKPFEIRKNDRDYRVMDTLYLREWNQGINEYTGDTVKKFVTYVLRDFGLLPGYVCMGISDIPVCPNCFSDNQNGLGYPRLMTPANAAPAYMPNAKWYCVTCGGFADGSIYQGYLKLQYSPTMQFWPPNNERLNEIAAEKG